MTALKEIHVVYCENVEYDWPEMQILFATESIDVAQKYCSKYNTLRGKLRKHYKEMEDNIDRKISAELEQIEEEAKIMFGEAWEAFDVESETLKQLYKLRDAIYSKKSNLSDISEVKIKTTTLR